MTFAGSGKDDGVGMGLENVELYSTLMLPNFIRNGDFENADMRDWISNGSVERRPGRAFNPNWPATSGSAIDLDTVTHNEAYAQVLHLMEGLYTLSLEYAARPGYNL